MIETEVVTLDLKDDQSAEIGKSEPTLIETWGQEHYLPKGGGGKKEVIWKIFNR